MMIVAIIVATWQPFMVPRTVVIYQIVRLGRKGAQVGQSNEAVISRPHHVIAF